MTSIDSLQHEDRHFPPSPEFTANAIAKPELYEAAAADRLGVLGRPVPRAAALAQALHPDPRLERRRRSRSGSPTASSTSPTTASTVTSRPATATGSRSTGRASPATRRDITYAELTAEVKRAANALKTLGIVQGDRVAIYLPMIPEAVVAMLAIARLGAIHSVVFGGFSADSLRARIDDAEAKLVITADGGCRKGKVFPLKDTVDTRASTARRADRARARRQARRERRRLDRGPRRLVARRDAGCRGRARGGGVRRREPALHPLHVGHDREAEGHPAHHAAAT